MKDFFRFLEEMTMAESLDQRLFADVRKALAASFDSEGNPRSIYQNKIVLLDNETTGRKRIAVWCVGGNANAKYYFRILKPVKILRDVDGIGYDIHQYNESKGKWEHKRHSVLDEREVQKMMEMHPADWPDVADFLSYWKSRFKKEWPNK